MKKILLNKTALTVVLALVAYILTQKIYEKIRRNQALKNLGETESNLANRLHKAFHPFLDFNVPIVGYLPDGTNEQEVLAVAAQIKQLNNLTKVQKAYNALYGITLDKALFDEGISNDFYEVVNGVSITPRPVDPNTGLYYFKTGDTVKVKQGYNMRNTVTGISLKTGDGKTKHIIKTLYANKTVAGIKGNWALVYEKDAYWWNEQDYLVFVAGLVP